jgi:hypothetical protein
MLAPLRRVMRKLFTGWTLVEGKGYTVELTRENGRVLMTIKGIDSKFLLELPMPADKAWLLGGRLQDVAHEATETRAGEAP